MSALTRWLAALAALVALLAPRAAAQDSSYERALAAYQRGDYPTAREQWLEALREGAFERAAVLYDLGNVAFREKRPLQAVAWYTASLRLAPRNADAWHNLEFARREAGLEPADRGDLRATAVRLLTMLTVAESRCLALCGAALLALALAWEAWRGGFAAKVVAAVLAFALLAVAAPWAYQALAVHEASVFVTQPEGAALRSEPRDSAALIARLAPASEAERIDALPEWVRVRSDKGETGWIKADSCLALDSLERP